MNGAVKLVLGHSRLIQKISSARSNLSIDDSCDLRKIIIHTHIDDAEVETMLTAEHIDATPTLGEVHHLLPSHLTRRDTDALMFDAVITTQQQMTRMLQRRSERLLNKTDLHGKGFETSQRALGLVEVINLILDDGAQRLIRRSYMECLHKIYRTYLIFTGIPLTIKMTSSAC